MSSYRFCLTLLAILGPSLAARVPQMKKVTLYKRSANVPFSVIKTIDDPQKLKLLSELWGEKAKLKSDNFLDPNEFEYSLTIEQGAQRGIWYYHPAGLTQILSKAQVPTYLINRVEELHTLLEIKSSDDKLVVSDQAHLSKDNCEKTLREILVRLMEKDEPATKVFTMKNPIEGKNLLLEVLQSGTGFEKIKAAAGLALLGQRDGVSILKGVESMTSTQIEFFYAKAALFLLNEDIPQDFTRKLSVFQEYEKLILRCQGLRK